jgi:hypothetical protein
MVHKVRANVGLTKEMSHWQSQGDDHGGTHGQWHSFGNLLNELSSSNHLFTGNDKGLPQEKYHGAAVDWRKTIFVTANPIFIQLMGQWSKERTQQHFMKGTGCGEGGNDGDRGRKMSPYRLEDTSFQHGMDQQIPSATPKIGGTCRFEQWILHDWFRLISPNDGPEESQSLAVGCQVHLK